MVFTFLLQSDLIFSDQISHIQHAWSRIEGFENIQEGSKLKLMQFAVTDFGYGIVLFILYCIK